MSEHSPGAKTDKRRIQRSGENSTPRVTQREEPFNLPPLILIGQNSGRRDIESPPEEATLRGGLPSQKTGRSSPPNLSIKTAGTGGGGFPLEQRLPSCSPCETPRSSQPWSLLCSPLFATPLPHLRGRRQVLIGAPLLSPSGRQKRGGFCFCCRCGCLFPLSCLPQPRPAAQLIYPSQRVGRTSVGAPGSTREPAPALLVDCVDRGSPKGATHAARPPSTQWGSGSQDLAI